MSMGKKQNKKPWSKPQTVYQRIASRLSARNKIIKLLEDSMRKSLGPRHVEEFLSMLPKTYSIKNKR